MVERFTELAIQTFLWAFRIVVILVVVVGSILTLVQGRYSAQAWIDLAITGAALGSVYALIALGYTMVYGILRMINFAHGEIFMAGMFAGYFTAVGLADTGHPQRRPAGRAVVGRHHVRGRRRGFDRDCRSSSSASPTGPCGMPRGWCR